jgi:hypothetical protein
MRPLQAALYALLLSAWGIGAGQSEGLEPPSETPALYPSFPEELRLFYSGIGPRQSEGPEPIRLKAPTL